MMKFERSRTVDQLQKLVESAFVGETKWSRVLRYLDEQSEESDQQGELAFVSPFPAYYEPSGELLCELWYDDNGDSVLRMAVMRGAPLDIIAALVHLGPEALEGRDLQERVLLHLVCRIIPTANTFDVIKILIAARPEMLLVRDTKGRTPLHYLFIYHPESRTPQIVQLFCQSISKAHFHDMCQKFDENRQNPLPQLPQPDGSKNIPNNAAILPDACHGCLPLHYAAAQRAPSDAIQALINAFPVAKHTGDRYGRTPLHWYLGAGHAAKLSVTGEAKDPNAAPWWDMEYEMDVIRLLLTSRVARTADARDRFPLHWAAVLQAHSNYIDETSIVPDNVLKILLDANVGQLVSKDSAGQTPLMVFLQTFVRLQDEDFQKGLRPKWDKIKGGPANLNVSLELFKRLALHPDSSSDCVPVAIEDSVGKLPLHLALEAAAAEHIIEFLVEQHPMSLVHSSDELLSPLHSAFLRRYAAPLHTKRSIGLLLRRYQVDTSGSFVEGYMSIKLEDSSGSHPLHYACTNNACLDVVKLLVSEYPAAALVQQPGGNLPIHCLLSNDVLVSITQPRQAVSMDEKELKDTIVALREKTRVVLDPIFSYPEYVRIPSEGSGFLPLHIGLLHQALDYSQVLWMLRVFPESPLEYSSDPAFSFTPIDIHEFVRTFWLRSNEGWHHIRELLFSFGPTLASHRFRQELLDRCVNVIVSETTPASSYHRANDCLLKSPTTGSLPHAISVTQELVGMLSLNSPRIDVPSTPEGSALIKSRSKDSIKGLKELVRGCNAEDDDAKPNNNGSSCYDVTGAQEMTQKMGLYPITSTSKDKEKTVSDVQRYLGESSGTQNAQHSIGLSEVGYRLWCFFTLFYDPSNPSDHYGKEVSGVMSKVAPDMAELLSGIPVPSSAVSYLTSIGTGSIGELASPQCREIIYKSRYFVEKYEFQPDGVDFVGDKGDWLLLRATSWIIKTVHPTEAIVPGISEASIWESGEVPAESSANFQIQERPVLFKFMKSMLDCANEVAMSKKVETLCKCDVSVPILDHFSVVGNSQIDLLFAQHLKDSRFNTLTTPSGGEFHLSDYFCAIVYPFENHSILRDHLHRYGIESRFVRAIGAPVARLLSTIHEEARVAHGSLSIESVWLLDAKEGMQNDSVSLSNLWYGQHLDSIDPFFAGSVNEKGRVCYRSGTLPPEMFVELSSRELELFEKYWSTVIERTGLTLEPETARVSFSPTGKAFVVRSYYLGNELTGQLPSLPYELVKVDPRQDIWSFGLILYRLLAGCPLFPLESRSETLLSYADAALCDEEYLERSILERVDDHLAQDLLFKVLAPVASRLASMKEVLTHPFIAGESSLAGHVIRGMLDKQRRVVEGFRRRQRLTLARQYQSKATDE